MILLSIFLSIVMADTPPPGVVQIKDSSGNKVTTTSVSGKQGLDVNVVGSSGESSTVNQGTPGPASSPWPIALISPLPLPVSDSITHSDLSTINSTLGSPFQAGGSIGNSSFGATQSGSWSVGRTWATSNGSDSMSCFQSSGSNLHVDIDNFPATQPVSFASPVPVIISGPSPLPVVGTVIVTNIPTVQISPLPLPVTISGPSPLPVSGNVVVSGTVIANQGASGPNASPWPVAIISLPSPVPVSQSGTWTTGRTWTLSSGTDSASCVQSTSPWVDNVSQFGGSNVVTGTGTSGSGIPRVTVSNDSNILATQSGSWSVTANAGTNLNTSALATSANQTNGTQQTEINNGANVSAVKAASTAPVATDPALVVALSPNGSQAMSVAQGSTTSGQTGTLVQGAVTTNVPSYSTAQTDPFSLNLHGSIRVLTMGGDAAQLIRNDYSSTNVTTAAYVQLVASTSVEINRLHIFDSSGQDFVLATGSSGSEVDQIQIPPGGWDQPIQLYIASGTRLSIKSKSATANSGILLITGLK